MKPFRGGGISHHSGSEAYADSERLPRTKSRLAFVPGDEKIFADPVP